MSVSDQDPYYANVANGVATVFSFPFSIAAEGDLVVQLDGVEQTLNVDYTVTGVGLDAGGDVEFSTAPADQVEVTLYRVTALERLQDFQTAGDLPAAELDRQYDAIWRAIQELVGGARVSSRAIRVPAGEIVGDLPNKSDRAGKFLAFDAAGGPTVGAIPIYALNPAEGFISATTLGAVGDGVTDDADALIAVMLAGLRIDFGDETKNYRITKPLPVRDHAYLRGGGARIFQDSLQTPIFDVDDTTDVTIIGLQMTGKAMTTAAAGTFVTGRAYSILTPGTTNFTLVGAASNAAGQHFVATGPGTGTGVASTFYNTSNSLDVAIKCNYAVNLVVAFCRFNGFAHTPFSMQLWGENPTFTYNVVVGPDEATLNPLGAPDPQIPGFRNCTGFTVLAHGGTCSHNKISKTSEGFIVGQQSTDVTVEGNEVDGTIVEHGGYVDAATQRVKCINNNIKRPRLIGMKVQWYDPEPFAASAVLKGGIYVIRTVGTTDWTAIGAASNTVGVQFKATGPGIGTGTATWPVPTDNKFVGNHIYETGAGGDGLIFLNSAPLDIANITGISKPTKGTAANATTNSAGYAVGATVITLASAGTGTILANDLVQFGNDQNYYMVTVGDGNVSNGGTITIAAPGLLNAIAASPTAITVAYSPGVVTINAAPTPALAADDWVVLDTVGGMTPMRSAFYIHTVLSPTSFIPHVGGVPVDTSGYPAFTSGGTLRRPVRAVGSEITGNTVDGCGQDAIGLRYLDGGIVDGNIVARSARAGISAQFVGNLSLSWNQFRTTQSQAISAFTPTDPIQMIGNRGYNPGAAGVDTAGASSGFFFEGDGGGTVSDNIAYGDRSRTKMLYAFQLGSGNKSAWSIFDNEGYDAEAAVVALHGNDNRRLRRNRNNIGTAATGINAYTGLATALPNVGNPIEDLWGDVAPTTGFWPQESRLWKRTPAAGDPIGFGRITSGSNPDDWRPFGIVHGCLPTQALQGPYAPTCTAAAGITGGTGGVTFGPTVYGINGTYCTVQGYAVANVTTTGTTVTFRITLPVAAVLGTAGQGLWGMAVVGELNSCGTGRVDNNGANDEAAFSVYIQTGVGNTRIYYSFTYRLNP